jgi:hypothetical protein
MTLQVQFCQHWHWYVLLLLLANAADDVCLCYCILISWSCKLLPLLNFLHSADADGVVGAGGQRRFDRGQFYLCLYLDASGLVKMVSKVQLDDIAMEADGFQAEEEEILDNECSGDADRVKKRIRKFGSSAAGSSGAQADQQALLDRLENVATKMMGGSPSQGGGSQHTSEQQQHEADNARVRQGKAAAEANEAKTRSLACMFGLGDPDTKAKSKEIMIQRMESGYLD